MEFLGSFSSFFVLSGISRGKLKTSKFQGGGPKKVCPQQPSLPVCFLWKSPIQQPWQTKRDQKIILISPHPCELMYVLKGELSFWRRQNIHHNDKDRFFSAQLTLLPVFDFLVLSAAISATRKTKKEFPEESRCFTKSKMRLCAQIYGPLRFPRNWICARFFQEFILYREKQHDPLLDSWQKESTKNW